LIAFGLYLGRNAFAPEFELRVGELDRVYGYVPERPRARVAGANKRAGGVVLQVRVQIKILQC
jgi:hypothetical protein